MTKLTMGSLFDGSGGFALGALLTGITPVWASEIAPFPIRVTTKRLPFMKHCGDIGQICGADIEPVDIITFGSPCTGLSVAGKRGGLEDKQSVLFFQAVRVIKEMKEATHGRSPRFIVWENVPGCYHSSGGRDFLQVLTEIVKIKDEGLYVPLPQKNKWHTAGELVGDGFSVAWRTLDAQFFGVAQRRRRCYLVADFEGERAGEILFESESLSGYTPQGGGARENIAARAENCVGEAGTRYLTEWDCQSKRVFSDTGVSPTLAGSDGGGGRSCGMGCVIQAVENHPADSRVKVDDSGTIQTLTGRMGTGGGNVPLVMNAMAYDCRNHVASEVSATLQAKNSGGHSLNFINPVALATPEYVIRRLLPQECALLQGFPPDWCAHLETSDPSDADIAWWAEVFETHRRITGEPENPKRRGQIIKWLKNPHSDSAEYAMWGNGVALPCVCFVMSGIMWAASQP